MSTQKCLNEIIVLSTHDIPVEAERMNGQVRGGLDWGLKGSMLFQFHSMHAKSLIKTLYPLLSTGSSQEDPSQHD